MTRLICLDLETTGVDVEMCEVVQFGGIEVDTEKDPEWRGTSKSMLCQPHNPIPAAATEVHGITNAMVAGKPHFSQIAASVFDWIGDALVVTFNGEGYDLPILERYTHTKAFPAPTRGMKVEQWRPQRSIDVMRVWNFLRRADTFPCPADHIIPASLMTGTLSAAFAWTHGRTFVDAHDAVADCRATLDVLSSLELVLDWCEKVTREPLPGDVDWAGKLKWSGEEIVFSFGKHKDQPVSSQPNYVSWMMKSDFHEGTKKILRGIQRGQFPKRVT